MWALRNPEEAAHVPITRGWESARAVALLWTAAALIAAFHVVPRELSAIVGVAAIHGGLLIAALTWAGVGLAESSIVIVLLGLARTLVTLHPLGALAFLAIPIWLARLAIADRLTRLGLGRPWPWGAAALGALVGSALALHLVTTASRTLGYGLHLHPTAFVQAFGYDIGANVLSAELFFRGALLQHAWRRWSFTAAVTLATTASTVRYCVDPFVANAELRLGAAVYMALLGVINAVLARWSGSVLPGMVAAVVFFACYRLLGTE